MGVMVMYKHFLFLIFIIIAYFTSLLGCKTKYSQLENKSDKIFNNFEPSINLDIINNINESLGKEELHLENFSEVSILENTFIDSNTTTGKTILNEKSIKANITSSEKISYNCNKYNEPYNLHFLSVPSITDADLFNNNLAKQLYYFTPLFQNFKLDEVFQIFSDSDIRAINSSYKKSYNRNHDTFSNFDSILNHYAKILTQNDSTNINMNKDETIFAEVIIKLSYYIITSRFFEDPYGNKEIDDIIFNIIIPFRNKIHCSLFNKSRHRHCRMCLDEYNIFKCCAFEFYDTQIKAKGEALLKSSAQVLHWELKEYITSKNRDSLIIAINCFYDEYTQYLCQVIKFGEENQQSLL